MLVLVRYLDSSFCIIFGISQLHFNGFGKVFCISVSIGAAFLTVFTFLEHNITILIDRLSSNHVIVKL